MKKIKNTNYTIKTAKSFAEKGKELTFFCISDLHGNIYEPDNQPILDLAVQAKPDLILASGDILSGESSQTDEVAVSLLSRLLAVAPVCYVNGNHEIQTRELDRVRYDRFIERLENCGVYVLNNRSIHLEIKGERVKVYGYELPWGFYSRFSRKRPDVDQMRNAIGIPKKDELNVLLTHNPVFFEEYAAWGADFVFAGHLHGGFIRLPILGGIISPQFQLFPRYARGMFANGESHMAVGAGMGNHSWLFRINNPTEAVVVKIQG